MSFSIEDVNFQVADEAAQGMCDECPTDVSATELAVAITGAGLALRKNGASFTDAMKLLCRAYDKEAQLVHVA